jgi:hypothetical protein
MKKIFATIILMVAAVCIYAVDMKYALIVNTTIADIKKAHSELSLLQGHVAINISSGNKELDSQFAEAIQKSYPNFASKADTVNNEDLYQMVVKIYRENSEVIVNTVVTNFAQKNIIDRTVKVKSVSSAVMETLQYKTAIAAKNEFDVYLDSAFGNTGEVVQNALLIPPPPPFDWSKMTAPFLPTFESDLEVGLGAGTNTDLNSFIALASWHILYGEISFGIKKFQHSALLDVNYEFDSGSHWGSPQGEQELVDYETTPLRFELGVMLPYNKYLLFPIGVGVETNMYLDDHDNIMDRVEDEIGTSWGLTFSAGAMIKIKSIFLIGRYKIGKHEIDNNFEFILGVAF